MNQISRLLEDARYGTRQFRRAPGYAVFTILVLALGIGTVTAMFTVSYGVLLKPLPFRTDRQLFGALEKTSKADEGYTAAYAELFRWQQATKATADVGFAWGGLNILDAPGGAELVSEVSSSPNLFSLLGIEPMMGRGFTASEEETDHPAVVLLSYATWQSAFGGDRTVLGKTVHMGGVLYTIVGVMPKQFVFPVYEDRPEVWVPLDRGTMHMARNDPYAAVYEPVVRLKNGVRLATVETQIESVHVQFATGGEPGRIHLARLHNLLVGEIQPALFALELAVALVWLIACSNVAGLQLARVTSRRGEIAVRVALGAGRGRIAVQLLTESLLLSAAGAIAGGGLAVGMLRTFRQVLATKLPLAENIELNWAVWLSLALMTLLTTLAFGSLPAWLAASIGTGAGLRDFGRRQVGHRAQNRVQALLLTGEVALSLALLIGGGLLARTMYSLRHVPLGFRTDHLVMTNLTAPGSEYLNRNVGTAAWQPLLDAVRKIPGVQDAALSTVLPLKHPVEWLTMVYNSEGTGKDMDTVVRAASPGLTRVLGIRMLSGRFFDPGDTASSPPVAVVNRTFVNRNLGGGNAIGKQIRFGHIPRTATIVGVIDDVHQDDLTNASKPEFYLCLAQIEPNHPLYRPMLSRYMQLVVKTETAPEPMIRTLRRGIREANPHLAIGDFSSMEEAVEDSIQGQRLAAAVVSLFAGLALLITVVGLYALLSYMVELRTPEIGVRMALGAQRGSVVRMFLRQTLVLLGAGVGIGAAVAMWSDRLLKGFLFGVTTSDPWTLGLAPMVLIVSGLLAALVPALKAASVDPLLALRAE